METKVQIMDKSFIKTVWRLNSPSLCDVDFSKMNRMSHFLCRDSLIYIVGLQPCVEF